MLRLARRAAAFILLRLTELAAAFMLLTRLRLPLMSPAELPIVRFVWAFPLVGATVGAVGAAAYTLCWMAGMPAPVGAAFALTAVALFTGALHEDGLADTADGFGGGRTRDRKLEIMRDSRIGSFGAVALILSLGARGEAIATLGQPARVLVALAVAGALARGGMIVLLLILGPARADGLAAGLRGRSTRCCVAGLVIASSFALLLLPFGLAGRAILGTLLVAVSVAWIAQRQIGGYTGDVLGATSVVAECVTLGLLAGP